MYERKPLTKSSWLNCALLGEETGDWVNIGQQCLVLGGTESVKVGTGSFLMALRQ